MLDKIFEVYGNALPERHIYAASAASPVTVLEITKQFRTWNAFVYEYGKYTQTKRVSKPVVTKKVKADEV